MNSNIGKFIINDKSLYLIHEIAIKLFHSHPSLNRDLLLFEALQTYLANNKIEVEWEVKQ